jgi:ketosteroid isomerase-like protein
VTSSAWDHKVLEGGGAPLREFLFRSRVERGWENVAARLDWASSKYSDGIRSRTEISGAVTSDFAYIVQTEVIRSLAGRTEQSKQELRVTMMFRREPDGWRIVHRHADSLISSQSPYWSAM